ncbi:MAG: S-methyl-5'-thioadenosine phosphorylase [Sandaracinaceae bacterium]|nr:S-methyl-5'-thioadenosine phosphorylase [Sandaracinaceae bacterium]
MTRGVLFLCTGNACRSQMAEGIARAIMPPGVRIFSAGTKPKGVDTRAVQVMHELGLDIAGHRSKALDDASIGEFDLVVALCGDAAEHCPSVPGCQHEHWPIVDPAGAAGSEEQVLAEFRRVRDELLKRISELAVRLAPEPALGVIGGSGFYELPGLSDARRVAVSTPFGDASGPLVEGRLAGRRVVFLARHGEEHRLLPGEVNARANIYALKRAGVARLVSVSAVGSLREEIAPGDVVLPNQFIDRTMGRPSTFFGQGVVAHASLADPVCRHLASSIASAAREHGARVHPQGTYVCIEGPQFSTRAESALSRSIGADVVGMTNLPEARLAREAELCYATLALPTDYDSWRPDDEVRVTDVLSVLMANVARAKAILASAFASLTANDCACQHTLDAALLTRPDSIDAAARLRLHAVLARRLGGDVKGIAGAA